MRGSWMDRVVGRIRLEGVHRSCPLDYPGARQVPCGFQMPLAGFAYAQHTPCGRPIRCFELFVVFVAARF